MTIEGKPVSVNLPRLLTAEDVAEYMGEGITPRAVMVLARRGVLRGFKAGRSRWRFTEVAVLAMIRTLEAATAVAVDDAEDDDLEPTAVERARLARRR